MCLNGRARVQGGRVSGRDWREGKGGEVRGGDREKGESQLLIQEQSLSVVGPFFVAFDI